MRKRIIAGNWKMNTERQSAIELAKAIVEGYHEVENIELILCPPAPFLVDLLHILKDSSIALGAQNMYGEEQGAFTGEVSPRMLSSVGCQYVIPRALGTKNDIWRVR